MRLLLTIGLLLIFGSAAYAEDELAAGDAFAAELLSGLRSAYAGIETERASGDEQALHIQYDVAIQNLTGLWQLLGIDWARQRLHELYAQPDCPDLHMGYSPSRRLLLRIEPLELRNADFADYTVFLCTLESLSEDDIRPRERGQLQVHLLDGSERGASAVEPGHPLWERLKNQAADFEAPVELPSGHNLVFKQLFAAEGLGREALSAVSLLWDDQLISLGWFENEVNID